LWLHNPNKEETVSDEDMKKRVALNVAETRTANAIANVASTISTATLLKLTQKGILTKEDALSVIEISRGAIADSGSKIIESNPSVLQALQQLNEIRDMIRKLPED
jgi:isopentenyl diphosphate isomerase/L-lactate dehydrogenase-like FMN-dependent dehydrogenase